MIVVVFCNYNTILCIFNPNLNLEMANMYQFTVQRCWKKVHYRRTLHRW